MQNNNSDDVKYMAMHDMKDGIEFHRCSVPYHHKYCAGEILLSLSKRHQDMNKYLKRISNVVIIESRL